MANIGEDASIDELEDDLQLHQVILQSLNEQRPNAVEERQELLDIIRDLETRLARLRRGGQATPETRSPVARAATPWSPVSQAQLDGANLSNSNGASRPPQWGSFSPYRSGLPVSVSLSSESVSRASTDMLTITRDGAHMALTTMTWIGHLEEGRRTGVLPLVLARRWPLRGYLQVFLWQLSPVGSAGVKVLA
jgi:hypothetical protein